MGVPLDHGWASLLGGSTGGRRCVVPEGIGLALDVCLRVIRVVEERATSLDANASQVSTWELGVTVRPDPLTGNVLGRHHGLALPLETHCYLASNCFLAVAKGL